MTDVIRCMQQAQTLELATGNGLKYPAVVVGVSEGLSAELTQTLHGQYGADKKV